MRDAITAYLGQTQAGYARRGVSSVNQTHDGLATTFLLLKLLRSNHLEISKALTGRFERPFEEAERSRGTSVTGGVKATERRCSLTRSWTFGFTKMITALGTLR